MGQHSLEFCHTILGGSQDDWMNNVAYHNAVYHLRGWLDAGSLPEEQLSRVAPNKIEFLEKMIHGGNGRWIDETY